MLRLSLILVFCAFCPQAKAQEIRPGVWSSGLPQQLPLPTAGYQVYMVGEMHGLLENEEFQLQYLMKLHSASGVRDIAIEEDSVYEEMAQSFVDGKTVSLPRELCLRAGILHAIRQFNASTPSAKIRIHLTDIDSPADAIRQHMLSIQKRIGAASVHVPTVEQIKEHGAAAAEQLKLLGTDARTKGELRTIEHSIRAYKDGLEVGTGKSKGSPYLEDREQAIASNIADIIRVHNAPSLLVLYGSDHVSRKERKDGGPNRNQPLRPVALRLQQDGIQLFVLVTFPLAGQSSWRGDRSGLLWSASDGHLSSGETLDHVLDSVPEAKFFYVDTKRERATLPSQDITGYLADAYVLFRSSTAMTNRCK